MKYSFDDYAIGLLKKDGRSLASKEIRRLCGVTRQEWYRHAGEVCRLLNKAKSVPKLHPTGAGL